MSLPYFPMYPTDFEADTSHLTLEEDGAYNRLLRLMWMTPGCSLPDDDAWVRRRMRVSQDIFDSVVAVILDEFFVRSKGRITNPKLAKIFKESTAAHNRRKKAGSQGGKAKALKANKSTSSNAKAMLKQPEPEPYKEEAKASFVRQGKSELSQHFQDFWDAYPHRNGKKNRGQAEKSFARAVKSGVTVQEIARGVSDMARDPDVQRGFARDPTTWLNQKGWTDEFPEKTKPKFKAINGGQHDQRTSTDPTLNAIAIAARMRRSPGANRN